MPVNCEYGTISLLRLENHEIIAYTSLANHVLLYGNKLLFLDWNSINAASVAVRIDKMVMSEVQVPT